jgi:hypothetical protein
MGMVAASPVLARERHTYKSIAKIFIPHLMNMNWAACLGVASLLALSGCTPVKVRLGMKVYLDKTPIASIAARLPKGKGSVEGPQDHGKCRDRRPERHRVASS